MDDVVTILMIVAYLGYSFYRASQKRKAAREKAAGRTETQEPIEESVASPSQSRPARPVGKSIEQMLEELVMDKPAREIIIERDPWDERSAETIPQQPFRHLEEDYSLEREIIRYTPIEVNESLESSSDNRRMTIDTPALEVERQENQLPPDLRWLFGPEGNFDLRKAVVYSEIINRPYA
jgi:hypothetical protein